MYYLKYFFKQHFSIFPKELSYLPKTICSQEQRPGMCLLHQQAPCSAILVVSPFSYNPTYQVIKYYLKKCQLSYLLQYPHIHPALLERCCKDHLFILVRAEEIRFFSSLWVGEIHCFTDQPTVSSLKAGQFESWSSAKLTRAEHKALSVSQRMAVALLVLIYLTPILNTCASFLASLAILKGK